jgi:hypothetical protein
MAHVIITIKKNLGGKVGGSPHQAVPIASIFMSRCEDSCLIQGVAINPGPLVAGPPLLPLGACKGQDEQNLLGGDLSNGVNMVAGASSCQLPYSIACRQLITQICVWDMSI